MPASLAGSVASASATSTAASSASAARRGPGACKRCFLSFESGNPLKHTYGDQPTLPKRKKSGADCVPCVSTIALKARADEMKANLINQLEQSEGKGEFYENFMEDRQRWIDLYNSSPGGSREDTDFNTDVASWSPFIRRAFPP